MDLSIFINWKINKFANNLKLMASISQASWYIEAQLETLLSHSKGILPHILEKEIPYLRRKIVDGHKAGTKCAMRQGGVKVVCVFFMASAARCWSVITIFKAPCYGLVKEHIECAKWES